MDAAGPRPEVLMVGNVTNRCDATFAHIDWLLLLLLLEVMMLMLMRRMVLGSGV